MAHPARHLNTAAEQIRAWNHATIDPGYTDDKRAELLAEIHRAVGTAVCQVLGLARVAPEPITP